jgi:Branched-chain amino acid ATP-binding cassette transporter
MASLGPFEPASLSRFPIAMGRMYRTRFLGTEQSRVVIVSVLVALVAPRHRDLGEYPDSGPSSSPPCDSLRRSVFEAHPLIIVRPPAQGLGPRLRRDIRALMRLADRVCVLNFGQKIAEGTPPEIAENPEVVRAYLGTKRHAAGG